MPPLEIPDLHNVRFQPQFEDLPPDGVTVIFVGDAHAEKGVVINAYQCPAGYIMLKGNNEKHL